MRQPSLVAALLLSMAASAVAGDQPARAPSFTPPVLLDSPRPTYPREMAKGGMDAWVLVVFTVKADGTTADVRVLETTDKDGRFNREAIRTVSRWRYKPAEANGTPVEHKYNTSRILFHFIGLSTGARPEIVSRLRAVDKALDERRPDEALLILTELESRKQKLTLYEFAHIHCRFGFYYAFVGQEAKALEYLWKAETAGPEVLGRGLYRSLLTLMLRFEILLGYYVEAAGSVSGLRDLGRPLPEEDPLMRAYARMDAAVKAGEPLRATVHLVNACWDDCGADTATWRYNPFGRKITFDQVEGRIDKVMAFCDRRATTAPVEAGMRWEIPASWGNCTLIIQGARGTRIKIVEE